MPHGGVPWASPVQGLFLHDVFKRALVFLPKAAKLIARAELVSRRAGELDVKGRGGEVDLEGGSREARREKKQVRGRASLGLQLLSHIPVSCLPPSLAHPQVLCL